jgi:hypothetical protein
MPIWIWMVIIIWVFASSIATIMQFRAGQLRRHYADGCPRPFFDPFARADGSRRPIFPRRHEGAIDELEHMLEHDRRPR